MEEIEPNRTGEPIAGSFWGEISPCEHLVQFYGDDGEFLDRLSEFVAGGLSPGRAAIVIATEPHRLGLEERLRARGVDLDAAAADDQYIALDADATLAQIVRAGWPHDELFELVVSDLMARAGRGGRSVRAFGEMVALLWAQGHQAATVRLEHLWSRFCRTKGLSLVCAYPRTGFTQDVSASMREICRAHSRIVEPA